MNQSFELGLLIEMTDLTPIPIPARQRWKQFRTGALPVIVFMMAVISMVFLWDRKVAPPSLTGEVMAYQGAIQSPGSGILEQFSTEPFHDVVAGQLLGVIRQVPAEQAELALASLRAEIALISLGAGDPVLNQQRNLLSWQSLRRDWLLARSDLAANQARLRPAELAFRRSELLLESEAGSRADAELAGAEFEALQAEAVELTELVAKLEESVASSRFASEGGASAFQDGIEAALRWKEAELKRLEAEMKPLPVYAPCDGRVTLVYRRNSDFVKQGEVILDLRADKPEYIIGYMRQPVALRPTEGMVVQVSMRGSRPAVADARILRVGSQFEPLGPAFQRPVQLVEERALPILISLPQDLPLRAGEVVDLRLPLATGG
jgi:multidrug resistance efflux pump